MTIEVHSVFRAVCKRMVVAIGALSVLLGARADLPSGYTAIDCVQSTGKEWFDTKVTSSSDINIELDMQVVSLGQSSTCIFGERVNDVSWGKHFALWINQATKKAALNYGGLDLGSSYSDGPTFEQRRIIRTDGPSFSVDGCACMVVDPESYSTFSNANTLYMFAMRSSTAGAVDNRSAALRVWRLKIWKGDVLVRDFVPCVNPDGVVGFYDVADHSGETGYEPFYANQSGAGAFVRSDIPEGYTRIGYVESTGSQVLNTHLTSSSSVDVEMDMEVVKFLESSPRSTPFFGERATQGKHFALWCDGQGDTKRVALNNAGIDSGYAYAGGNAPKFDVRRTFRNKGVDIYIDGVRYYDGSSTMTHSNNSELYLFGMNNGSSTENRKIQMRVYGLRIWKGGKLEREYVPVTDSNGKAGLFDLVHAADANAFITGDGLNFGETVNCWLAEPGLEKYEWSIGDRVPKICLGHALKGSVVCSHTDAQLAALTEGTYDLTFSADGLTRTHKLTVKRPFSCTFARNGRTATFGFPIDVTVREMTVAYGKTDAGASKSSWEKFFTVQVPANVTSLADVAMPDDFGEENRSVRMFLPVDSTVTASDVFRYKGSVVIKSVKTSGDVPSSALIVFTPADRERKLFFAWSRRDAGASPKAWDGATVVELATISKDLAEMQIEFPDAAKAQMAKGGGFRLFLEGEYLPKGYEALQYVASSGTQGIDTGFRPGPKTACTVKAAHYGDFRSMEGVNRNGIKQMRLFGSRAGLWSDRLTKNDLFYEVYLNGSSYWACCMTDAGDGAVKWTATDVLVPEAGSATKYDPSLLHVFRLDAPEKAFYIDGMRKVDLASAPITAQAPTTLRLMNGMPKTDNINTCFRGCVCYARIEDDGVLARDLVPCVNPQQEIGFYDRSDHTGEVGYQPFYRNNGASVFASGDKVKEDAYSLERLSNGLPYDCAVSEFTKSSRGLYLIVY